MNSSWGHSVECLAAALQKHQVVEIKNGPRNGHTWKDRQRHDDERSVGSWDRKGTSS